MPNQATVTAKSGPNIAATATVFSGLVALNVDFAAQILTIVMPGNLITTFDLYGVATVTYTIASHQATLAFS